MVNTTTEVDFKYLPPHHLEDKVVLKRPHRCHYSTDTPINATDIVLLIKIRDKNYDNTSRRGDFCLISWKTHLDH